MSSSDYRSPNYNWVFKSQFSSARAQAPAMGAARQSSSSEEKPKEGPTIYHGRDVPGERIISHTIEHKHYRFPQEPPILFTFGDQVGIPVSILLFGPGRKAPIGGRGTLPFPGYSPSADVTVKGCSLITGEKVSTKFALTKTQEKKVVLKDFVDLALFLAERFIPITLSTDPRTASTKVVLWNSGEKAINPFGDLLLVALEHCPSEFAWRPVFFRRNLK